ncbi:MAG: antibiotic biosynthesis monooxygenase family protein [Thermoanaerobaculia bacterium]
MYVLLWFYQPAAGREEAFERTYGMGGDWAAFFRKGDGYLGTELWKGESTDGYVTVDRWETKAHFEEFRSAHHAEYEALDRGCEHLTAVERFLDAYEAVG